MFQQKLPRITNMYSEIGDGEKGEWLSAVVVESTKPFTFEARSDDNRIIVEARGVILNMPEETLEVYDGLLQQVSIKQSGKETVSLEMIMERPVEFRCKAFKGFPFRLEVAADRAPVTRLFSGKNIVIDPGHGGKDIGGRGPVSLREKDVVAPIAKYLERVLLRAGANVFLTRKEDKDISLRERFEMARLAGADVFISIHTRVCADSMVDGAATLYAPSNSKSAVLARYVQEELVKKLRSDNGGIAEQPGFIEIKEITAIEVEVLTITNLVEEVFLRDVMIRKKAAEGIFNGLIKFFKGGSK